MQQSNLLQLEMVLLPVKITYDGLYNNSLYEIIIKQALCIRPTEATLLYSQRCITTTSSFSIVLYGFMQPHFSILCVSERVLRVRVCVRFAATSIC